MRLGDVVVQIDVDGRRVTGRGVATDVVEASARAYLAAVNRALQIAGATTRHRTQRGHAVTELHDRRDPGRRHRPEVVAEGLKVLDAVRATSTFELVDFDLGAERYLRTGDVLPDEELDAARARWTPSSWERSATRA